MITHLKDLNWESIGKLSVILVGLFILGTTLHYIGRGVLELNTTAELTPKEKFESQYNLYEINIDSDIHEKMNRTLKKVDADWIFFWGFHNGTEMGPFHIKRMSVIDEIAAPGKKFQLADLQNISTAQFSTSLKYFWKTPNKIRSLPTQEMHSFPNLKYAFENLGIYWLSEQALSIKGVENPIGIIGIYYGKEKAQNLKGDKEAIANLKQAQKSLVNYIKYQLLRKRKYGS